MYELIKQPTGKLEIVERDDEGLSQVIATVGSGVRASALRLVRLANMADLSGVTDEELEVISAAPPGAVRELIKRGSSMCPKMNSHHQ